MIHISCHFITEMLMKANLIIKYSCKSSNFQALREYLQTVPRDKDSWMYFLTCSASQSDEGVDQIDEKFRSVIHAIIAAQDAALDINPIVEKPKLKKRSSLIKFVPKLLRSNCEFSHT